MTTAKRRPRRIAADEAHAWARNLRLRNLPASIILRSLSLYVDGEGVAFVAIPTLAEDCDGMSIDTVRRRLVWLEHVGAIARQAQWLDENGVRNGEGRGKRTTDRIRLLYDADPEAIEARAQGRIADDVGETSVESTAISPSRLLGLNSAVALGQPSVSPSSTCDHLISEPEPESPPLPPSGGEGGAQIEESEPEDFQPAWSAWRGHETKRRDLALDEFRKLPKDKQRLCRAAIPLFNAMKDKLRESRVPNFHLWIRSGGFEEFPNAALADDRPQPSARRLMQGEELDGFTVAMRIARQCEPVLVEDQQLGRGVWTRRSLEPDLVAMAVFVGDKREQREAWELVEEGTPRFAAWRDRLRLWLGGEIKAERVWLEPFDQNVHGLSATHPNFKLRKSKNGFRVPAPWPPRRDGTWSSDSGEAA
jgi:hypothetical protein